MLPAFSKAGDGKLPDCNITQINFVVATKETLPSEKATAKNKKYSLPQTKAKNIFYA